MTKFNPEAIFTKKFLQALTRATTRLCKEAEKARAEGDHTIVTKLDALASVIELEALNRPEMGILTEGPNGDRVANQVIGHLFNYIQGTGALAEFKCVRGQYGGVRRKDEPKPEPKATKAEAEVDSSGDEAVAEEVSEASASESQSSQSEESTEVSAEVVTETTDESVEPVAAE